MNTPLLLGIDLGTTAIKAVLLGEEGQVGQAGLEYESLTPQEGWVEQSPQVWIETTLHVIRKLFQQQPGAAARVVGIGFSGQMHGTVVLDKNAKPLRNAIIWADQRSRAQVAEINRMLGEDELLRITGNPLFPGFMLASLVWIKENEPETWQQCRYSLLPKDYLRYAFIGRIVTEPSDASSTCLLDISRRKWDERLLETLGLYPSLLPPILTSSEIAGILLPYIAKQTGLQAGIPVVCGGSDQACQAVGNGIIVPGQVSVTIGTGGQILTPIDQPAADEMKRLHLFCHVLPDLWHLEAATLSAGLSLRWLRDVLGGTSYQELADIAECIPPGSEGLFFAPYLLGERTPYMDASLRGGFLGLSFHHRRAHLTRAVMEGVVLSLRKGLELVSAGGHTPDRIVAAGGALRHSLWLQLQANIFNLPIIHSKTNEPAAAGAAILAGVGTGVFADLQAAIEKLVQYSDPIIPQTDQVLIYNRLYQQHLQLFDSLKPFTSR